MSRPCRPLRLLLISVTGLSVVVAALIEVPGQVMPFRGGASSRRGTDRSASSLPASTTSTTAPAPDRRPEGGFDVELSVLRDADAPDPFVMTDRHQPWMFTTNNKVGNVPMGTIGADGRLVVADALPRLPPWAVTGYTWAPALTSTDSGWVLAFTARDRASGRQCIGIATAPSIHGPYTPAPQPLVCHPDQGGSIDPSFVANPAGRRWLLYKSDGNCCGLPTALHAIRLSPDATGPSSPPADLLTADRGWEGDLVEAPTMTQLGDRWLLLYSANRWNTPDYAVGAAWCATPMGPCNKQAEPALTASADLQGPGGVEFVAGTPAASAVVTFHAWPAGAIGYQDGGTRRVHLGWVNVTDETVTVTPREAHSHG